MTAYRHLFGPVPSRRLGRSLGVDLVPAKTCSANCVFCQLGRTARPTVARREHVPTGEVLRELADWFARGGAADYVTLAGSGEPTLHSRFGEVLAFIRRRRLAPSALLSNGTLFDLPEVRAAARQAAVVKLSLNAWDQASFERVNRPHPSLRFERIIAGYRAFRREYRGQIWLEVFLVPGLNARQDAVRRIAALAATFAPDRIHLNTVARPPAEPSVRPVAVRRLRALAGLLTPAAEVAAERPASCAAGGAADGAAILALLRRHPATEHAIAQSFGATPREVGKQLQALIEAGRVRTRRTRAGVWYVPVRRSR